MLLQYASAINDECVRWENKKVLKETCAKAARG